MNRIIVLVVTLIASLVIGGCSVFAFIGAGKQAMEDQMLIEKPAEFSLEGKSVAVVIDTDLSVHYEHPGISNVIAEGIAGRIAMYTDGVSVLHPRVVAQWQFETPQWSAMPTTDIARALNVDVVIFIDLHNYSLTPPGNQWLWDGYCSASIGIIEATSYEEDGFVDMYEIQASFPRKIKYLTREESDEATIERGLLAEFIKQTSWLFYLHTEPKHPDRYRPELDA
ncbi:MAG TPA: hypothetical protein EYO31_03090 [Phycisphaerales bacterium]|nr:hypothetical protein [Phycisphaerales bacterium]